LFACTFVVIDVVILVLASVRLKNKNAAIAGRWCVPSIAAALPVRPVLGPW
jgi:hypothetical protein